MGSISARVQIGSDEDHLIDGKIPDYVLDFYEKYFNLNLDILYKANYDRISKGICDKDSDPRLYAVLRRRYLREKMNKEKTE